MKREVVVEVVSGVAYLKGVGSFLRLIFLGLLIVLMALLA